MRGLVLVPAGYVPAKLGAGGIENQALRLLSGGGSQIP